jgi:hypothetical protein
LQDGRPILSSFQLELHQQTCVAPSDLLPDSSASNTHLVSTAFPRVVMSSGSSIDHEEYWKLLGSKCQSSTDDWYLEAKISAPSFSSSGFSVLVNEATSLS